MFLKENEKVAGGTGVYKKQKFGHAGGEINSHIDFLGKINSIFPLTRVKIDISLFKYSIFKHICNSFEYFVC